MKLGLVRSAILLSCISLVYAQATPIVVLAWGETSLRRIVETQTTFVRRKATAEEQRAAVQKGKAIFNGLTPQKKAEFQKKNIRYIAVKLPPPKKSASSSATPKKPTGSASTPVPTPSKKVAEADDFMIYDTLGGSTVNKYVYTPKDTPLLGAVMKMDDYEALYVGL